MPDFRYFLYSEEVDKEDIFREMSDWYYVNTGMGKILKDIHWFNSICSSDISALEFLDLHDKDVYDCLAVRCKFCDEKSATRKLLSLYVEANKINSDYNKLRNQLFCKDFKVKTIRCKHCGAKFETKSIKSNYCPICRVDMRSETLKNQIESLRLSLEKTYSEIHEEVGRIADKKGKSEDVEILWLIKMKYNR